MSEVSTSTQPEIPEYEVPALEAPVFEEPPDNGGFGRPRQQTGWFKRENRDLLRAHPDQWAKLSNEISQSSLSDYRARWPCFEFRTARDKTINLRPNRGAVYARYVSVERLRGHWDADQDGITVNDVVSRTREGIKRHADTGQPIMVPEDQKSAPKVQYPTRQVPLTNGGTTAVMEAPPRSKEADTLSPGEEPYNFGTDADQAAVQVSQPPAQAVVPEEEPTASEPEPIVTPADPKTIAQQAALVNPPTVVVSDDDDDDDLPF